MGEEATWDGLVTRYRDNLHHVTDCLRFASRIRARFVATFGWPDDAESTGLCFWASVSPDPQRRESRAKDANEFIVTSDGSVRAELAVCVRAGQSESDELRVPITIYRAKDGALAAQVGSALGQAEIVSTATDDELSQSVRAATESLLTAHVARCFT